MDANETFCKADAKVHQWVSNANAAIPDDVKVASSAVLNSGEVVVDYRRVVFSPTGDRLIKITAFNVVSQATRKIVVDYYGAEVDYESMMRAQDVSYRRLFGFLDVSLYEKSILVPESLVEVTVELEVTLPPKPMMPDRTYRRMVATAVARSAAPVVTALSRAGASIRWQSKYAPLLHIRVPAGKLLAVKDTPGILHMKEFVPYHPVHCASQSTVDLNLPAVFYANNSFGGNVAVGVSHEEVYGNCRVAPHSYYGFGQVAGGDIQYSTTAQTACTADGDCNSCNSSGGLGVCREGRCVSRHANMVVGMIGHAAGILAPRGAPLVDLYFNNNSSWNHGQQLDWFYGNYVTVENESWTGAADTFKQDYYPIVGMAISEAAANGGVNAVASCAANSICVGGYLDTSSIYDSTSTKNPVDCSRWNSGQSCDLELPHICLHGENAVTTAATLPVDSMVTVSGTSLAAPAAAGLVALMNERWPQVYGHWPEATRAALMAAADRDVHQIAHTPACPTTGKTFSDYHCPDERDGAGIPNATRLAVIANNNQVTKWMLYRDSSFDANDQISLQTVYLQQGQRLRAVLSWDACPTTYIAYEHANGVHADLDLHVLDPNGIRVFDAASYDGGYEIAEIVTNTSGNYTLEVQKFSWQDCTYLGGTNAYVYAALAYDIR